MLCLIAKLTGRFFVKLAQSLGLTAYSIRLSHVSLRAAGAIIYNIAQQFHSRKETRWNMSKRKAVHTGRPANELVKSNTCLLFLFFLVKEHHHEHVVCEPEYCSDWGCSQASLALCNQSIVRESEGDEQN